jgi:curli biogenesis system outer membrane secretion channel CsgG
MRIKLFAVALSTMLAFSAFAAKPVLAVAEFKNEVNNVSWWSSDVARELSGMLTNELASTGKFKMVEREKLSKVLDEQDLADSGRVNKATGAKIGKLTGAQYLVVATVTAFESQTRGTGGGVSFRGISVGGKKEDAYISIDLRVIDTTTGEVEYTRSIEARASSGGVAVGVHRGGFGGALEKYENTPTGKAIRAMTIEASEYLACAMVDQDGCEDEYAAKEKSRKEKTKKAIKLD